MNVAVKGVSSEKDSTVSHAFAAHHAQLNGERRMISAPIWAKCNHSAKVRWVHSLAPLLLITAWSSPLLACDDGAAVPDPENNPGLVADCEALLAARDELAGNGRLNWSAGRALARWEGIRGLRSASPRVKAASRQQSTHGKTAGGTGATDRVGGVVAPERPVFGGGDRGVTGGVGQTEPTCGIAARWQPV